MKTTAQFSKRESKQRFEAALRGARAIGSQPAKTCAVKRGRPTRDSDPMPTDPEALIAWGKRNIQRD
jgi:hypothetical protein